MSRLYKIPDIDHSTLCNFPRYGEFAARLARAGDWYLLNYLELYLASVNVHPWHPDVTFQGIPEPCHSFDLVHVPSEKMHNFPIRTLEWSDALACPDCGPLSGETVIRTNLGGRVCEQDLDAFIERYKIEKIHPNGIKL